MIRYKLASCNRSVEIIKITAYLMIYCCIVTKILTSQLTTAITITFFYLLLLVLPKSKMVLFYRVSATSIKKGTKTTCKLL